ncbi:MAG TPA: hypothetical protein VG476_10775 [Acidimicrobiales bacterium]|nr:hypothetical protein [Acidimicrobiales bacterium]
MAAAAGPVGPGTVVVTTVHEDQVLAPGEIPVADHDMWLDLPVTPERVIELRPPGRRSDLRGAGIRWDELTPEKIGAVPLLQQLRTRGTW